MRYMPIVLLWCCCAVAQEQNPKFDRLIEAVKRAHTDRINGMQDNLDKKIKTAKTPQDKAKLKDLRAGIAAAKKEKSHHLPKLNMPPKAGEIGTLPDSRAHVVQVIDKQNMLCKVTWVTTVAKIVGGRAFPEPKTNSVMVWIKGRSTEGIADGGGTDLNVPWEVIGNKTYETNAASNTVMVLEQFDMPAFDAYRAKK